MVSKNSDSKCRVLGCPTIIREADSLKFHLMDHYCVKCFVDEKQCYIGRIVRSFEGKKDREKECRDNYLVSLIRYVIVHLVIYNKYLHLDC